MDKLKLKFTAKPKDALIFVLFCIFLLYLVAIGVLNLYEIAHNNRFYGLNPIKAFSSDFLVSTLTLYLLALLAVFSSTSSYFFDREKGFGFGKKKEKNEGWSRWMKDDEMKKAYNIKHIRLKDDTYESAGIPIIINEKEAWVDDGENHSLIIGGSGTGKTATIIDPLVKILGKAGESMVITDPKGELYENSANMLREKGYNVILVNFRDPEHGEAWNPLTLPYRYWKDGKEDKAMELLEDLAMNILVDANNQDPFWQKSAADYFTGLALGLFEDATSEDEVNLNSINAMSTFGEERIGGSKYDKEYFKLKGELSSAYISAAATVLAPADTKGGITSTFRQKIRIFSSRQKLAEMLSYTSFDVRKIGTQKTAMFLKVHDEKTTYHALATIFVKQVYECLIDEAQKCEKQKLPIRTNFILDEFANMPALKDVESMITASRSRNIRFNFGIQNFSQLNKVYGKDVAETIKGNCGNMFYLITTEYAALEEISKLLGDAKPKDAKEGKPQPPIRPLVTVSDLQQMKQFEMIIKRWRNNPFKTKHTPSFKIAKEGGWGYEVTTAGYPTRETKEIKTFDIKKFVDDHRMQDESNPFGGFGPGGFVPPFGAPSIGRGMMNDTPSPITNTPSVDDLVKRIDEQIAKIEAEEKAAKEKEQSKTGNEFEELVNKKYEEFKNKVEEQPSKEIVTPEIVKPENKQETFNVDDLLRRIDEKIAELEKEEALEAQKNQVNNPVIDNPFDLKEKEEVVNDVAKEQPETVIEKTDNLQDSLATLNPFSQFENDEIGRVEEDKPKLEDLLSKEEIKEEVTKPIEETNNNIKEEVTKPSNEINNDVKEELTKPEINIDADSIVLDDRITDDEFFDDFFGDDDLD